VNEPTRRKFIQAIGGAIIVGFTPGFVPGLFPASVDHGIVIGDSGWVTCDPVLFSVGQRVEIIETSNQFGKNDIRIASIIGGSMTIERIN